MDIEKTKRYYDHLNSEDICNCVYCRNYIKEIRTAYKDFTAFLQDRGVDIEKPFETIPIGPEKGVMYYAGAQYIILGTPDDFKETLVDDTRVFVTDSHPMTGIEEDHFVIEVSPITLKWNGADEEER